MSSQNVIDLEFKTVAEYRSALRHLKALPVSTSGYICGGIWECITDEGLVFVYGSRLPIVKVNREDVTVIADGERARVTPSAESRSCRFYITVVAR